MLLSSAVHTVGVEASRRPIRSLCPQVPQVACPVVRCSNQPSGFCRRAGSISHRAVRLQAKRQQFATFDDMLLGSDQPVLVDFSARWCGPCQMMSGVLAVLAKKLQPHCKVVKIDTDKYPNLASRNQVQALPTLVLFQNGQPIDRIEGFMNEMQLLNRVQKALGQ
ncbi:hypothetical protein WJX74_001568 [Apatococcus lobatus]|uniref:Thioredoxin domain-containing protein n=1 Tax=Apatococcus lobatus TaxID=904363 RepID=A0AAW1RDR4_9CHLO